MFCKTRVLNSYPDMLDDYYCLLERLAGITGKKNKFEHQTNECNFLENTCVRVRHTEASKRKRQSKREAPKRGERFGEKDGEEGLLEASRSSESKKWEGSYIWKYVFFFLMSLWHSDKQAQTETLRSLCFLSKSLLAMNVLAPPFPSACLPCSSGFLYQKRWKFVDKSLYLGG